MSDELDVLRALPAGSDHVTTEAEFVSHGWTRCGVGDWAVVLRSPSGELAARISPFDPVATYTVRLFREAADTGEVPTLHAYRELAGGAVVTVMEHLLAAAPEEAERFFDALEERRPEVAELADVVARVLADARDELPWCDRVDPNPANVMRRPNGELVLTDPFFADGRSMYGSLLSDPTVVARMIPADRRRHMFELPLAESGPWDPVEREQMRAALADADARLG